MKKMFLLLMIVVAFSCQKEDLLNIEANDISAYQDEFGMFRKELLIYDQSGQNSVFLLIHSDIKGAIEHYLKFNELKLIIKVDENKVSSLKSGTVGNNNSSSSAKATIPDEILKRQVSVELITENIKENVKSYYLSVKSKDKQLKSDFIFNADYSVVYKTTGDFIGVSNYGNWSAEDKWDIYCYLEKTNSWLAGWDVLWQGFLEGNASDYYYWAWLDYTGSGNPWYKIGTLLYTDPRVPTYNFLIAYSKNSFRGHSCTIGSYDTRNCFVGTAPSGTTAFIWTDAAGQHFYNTPLSGNQCPYPGSTFDGYNCHVLDVPLTC